MKINNEFDLEQTVFLKTDKEQLPRLVTGIKVIPGNILLYLVSHNASNSFHYAFEMSATKDQLLPLTN